MPDTLAQLVAELAPRLAAGRYLLGIAGPPGAGKSTLAAALAREVNRLRRDDHAAIVVPMDGFHLTHAELAARGIGDRKGAPHTFDAEAFVQTVHRLAAVPPMTVLAPRYDRARHEPVADAILVPPHAALIVIEGNYLLLDEAPWRDVPMLLDEVWHLDVRLETALGRARRRHLAGGCTPAEADAKLARNDRPNAERIAAAAPRADRVVRLDH